MPRSLSLYTTTNKPSPDGLYRYEPLDFILDFEQFWEMENYILRMSHAVKNDQGEVKAYLGRANVFATLNRYTELLSEVMPNLTYEVAKQHTHNVGVLSVIAHRMTHNSVIIFIAED